MMVDARTISADQVIETEVCIVGSGPAGITLAKELSHQQFQVCLLESGNFEDPTPETASLAEVETAVDFVPMTEDRLERQTTSNGTDFTQVTPDRRNRRFGGNAKAWGIRLGQDSQGNELTGLRHVPMAAADFEQRDWMPYSGWPFDLDHLQPYYERSHQVLKMGPCRYEGSDWESTDNPQLPIGGDRLTTRVFQFSRRDVLYEEYRQELDQVDNVTTYLNANVVELETDETASRVTRVKVACINGPTFWVAAKVVILAVGGVEAAQLLLLSNRVQPAGLGNAHDLVGRFFMDHPLVYGGQIIPSDPQLFNSTALYDLRQINGNPVMGHLTFTNEALRREPLPNISLALFPRQKRFLPPPAIKSLKALFSRRAFKEGPQAILRHIATALLGSRDVLEALYDKITHKPLPFLSNLSTGGWSSLQPNKEKVYHAFDIVHQTEQLPDPNNRVVLSEQVDILGRRKAQMQVRWTPEDIASIRRAYQAIAEEVERAGIGRFVPAWDGDLPYIATVGASHHMGTTRMHTDPTQGVVDANCKVHGVSNLYIASSSVFPTGGYANPTLTIVALAIRLADQVKTLMREQVEAGHRV